MALKDGANKAKPSLLEPIMKVVVVTPEEHMGDVVGDLNRRRGIIPVSYTHLTLPTKA